MIETIAAVIPAYSPDDKLLDVVNDAVQNFKHVIVVDDGSSESARAIFCALGKQVSLLKHEKNLGKGAAIKTALKFCLHLPIDGVVTIDADGQHLPRDVASVAEFSEKAPESFVLGVRNFSEKVPLRSKFGNKMTLAILRIFYGISLSDSQTGLRYIPRHLFDIFIELPGNRYEFELQCLLSLHQRNAVISQIPITTVYIDDNQSSHFRPLQDSARIYGVFFKFSLSSLICFGIDIALFSIIFSLSHNVLFATSIARVFSGVCNFYINLGFVFNYLQSKNTKYSALKYFALWVFLLLTSASLVGLMNHLYSEAFIIPIKIFIDVSLFVLSYRIQKNFVFR